MIALKSLRVERESEQFTGKRVNGGSILILRVQLTFDHGLAAIYGSLVLSWEPSLGRRSTLNCVGGRAVGNPESRKDRNFY